MRIPLKNESEFSEYKDLFVQRLPRYAVKQHGEYWRTRKHALHDNEIKKHLNH